jgi:hypothetical protein
MNDQPGFSLLKDIPFWVLFIFIAIGAICEIVFLRLDLLTSIIPIALFMIVYIIFRRPARKNQ